MLGRNVANDANLKTNITADNRQFVQSTLEAKRKVQELAKAIKGEYALSMKEAQSVARASFADTKRQLEGVQRELKATSNYFRSLGRDLLAAFSVGAIITTFKRVVDNIDSMAATAVKLDIPIEQFQLLEYAAKRSDTGIDTLDQGLKRLRATLSQALNGNKAAIKSFSDLGLSAKDLSNMNLSDAYQAVAGKIAGKGTSQGQASAAIGVFGIKQGQEQLNMIRGLQEATKEYKDLGIGLTKQEIETYKVLEKQLDQTSSRIDDGLKKAVIGLTPAIVAMGNAFGYAVSKGFGLITIAEGLSEGATALRNMIQGEYNPNSLAVTNPNAKMGNSDYIERYRGIKSQERAAVNRRNRQIGMMAGTSAGDLGTSSSGALNATTGAQELAQSFKDLSLTTKSAAEALKTFKEGTLKSILGIKEADGKNYLSSILKPVEQIKDSDFNSIATELRDFIEGGGKDEGFVKSRIDKLDSIATMYSKYTDPGKTTNSGMIAAVKQLKDATTNIQKKQEVNVIIKVKDNEFISAVVENDRFFKAVTDLAVSAADESAREAVR